MNFKNINKLQNHQKQDSLEIYCLLKFHKIVVLDSQIVKKKYFLN